MELRYTFTVPIHTISEMNSSEHYFSKTQRKRLQKKWIWFTWKKNDPKVNLPCEIHLKRLGKKEIDDDNLPSSMKYVRDAIADLLIPDLPAGKADGDKRIKWFYSQEFPCEDYGIVIQIYF